MGGEKTPETGTWLQVSERILTVEPARLQLSIVEICAVTPCLGSYASDLARLRLIDSDMENSLYKIWNAESPARIDDIICRSGKRRSEARALFFFAELVKKNLRQQAAFH